MPVWLSRGGQLAVYATAGTVQLRQTATGQLIAYWDFGPMLRCCDAAGRRVVVGFAHGRVQALDLVDPGRGATSGAAVQRLSSRPLVAAWKPATMDDCTAPSAAASPYRARPSRTEQVLAVGTADGTVMLLQFSPAERNVRRGQLLQAQTATAVTELGWSSDGAMLRCRRYDGLERVLDVGHGSPVAQPAGELDWTQASATSPDGHHSVALVGFEVVVVRQGVR